MIARQEATTEQANLWSALAAPLPAGTICWRQDGKAKQRDGQWYARFVAYVEAGTVRERLDGVCAGAWDLTLDLLPPGTDHNGEPGCAFKARLQILGVIREDIGQGSDYKAAATDAFKRASVRFGIGHELYGIEQNWVQVDGDGKFAKPLEDPQAAYDRRRSGRAAPPPQATQATQATAVARAPRVASDEPVAPARPFEDPAPTPASNGEQLCPKCDGRMWDNRVGKRNPKAPDFKCRDRSCDGVVWPANSRGGRLAAAARPATPTDEDESAFDSSPLGDGYDDEPLPF